MVEPPGDDEPAAASSTPFDSVVGRMEAQLSRGRPSGPVESPPEDVPIAGVPARPAGDPGFAVGVSIGVAALAAMFQLWLAVELAPLERVYRELTAPPLISRLVVSAAWRFGSFAALVALVPIAYRLGRRRRWVPHLVATIAIVVVVLTHLASRMPLYALAGNIR